MLSCLVTSDSLQPHGRGPTRLLCPWGSPGKNIGVGFHALLQGNLPNPGIKPRTPALQVDSWPAKLPGKPGKYSNIHKKLLWVYYREEEYGGSRIESSTPPDAQLRLWVHLSVPGGLMFVSMDYLETSVLFQKHQKFIHGLKIKW